MYKLVFALGLVAAGLASAAAQAAIPQLNFTCATGIAVHADEGGPVFIDGEEAALEVFNDDYAEASLDGTTISIAVNTDGTPDVSYTGPGGANGVCNPEDGAAPAATGVAIIPFFNAECPGDISVHADQGGPVYINGQEAQYQSFSETYFEAALDGTTISVASLPDGSLDVSYTGPDRANGVCRLQ